MTEGVPLGDRPGHATDAHEQQQTPRLVVPAALVRHGLVRLDRGGLRGNGRGRYGRHTFGRLPCCFVGLFGRFGFFAGRRLRPRPRRQRLHPRIRGNRYRLPVAAHRPAHQPARYVCHRHPVCTRQAQDLAVARQSRVEQLPFPAAPYDDEGRHGHDEQRAVPGRTPAPAGLRGPGPCGRGTATRWPRPVPVSPATSGDRARRHSVCAGAARASPSSPRRPCSRGRRPGVRRRRVSRRGAGHPRTAPHHSRAEAPSPQPTPPSKPSEPTNRGDVRRRPRGDEDRWRSFHAPVPPRPAPVSE